MKRNELSEIIIKGVEKHYQSQFKKFITLDDHPEPSHKHYQGISKDRAKQLQNQVKIQVEQNEIYAREKFGIPSWTAYIRKLSRKPDLTIFDPEPETNE